MFEPSDKPRLFGVPSGADFPAVLVDKIRNAFKGRPPEGIARVRIIVNTRRMERRLLQLFCDGGPTLLPKISVVTDLAALLPGANLPEPISRLRRKLDLTQLTVRLIEAEPDIAARSSAVDLADSLAALMDELQGESVDPLQLHELDVGDVSAHWTRSLKFLGIVSAYLDSLSPEGADQEARRLRLVESIQDAWANNPPQDPIIMAGSTGSRHTTRMFMRAVAALPQGAILLPGFDFDLPQPVWETFDASRTSEDHPQYRFGALFSALGASSQDVEQWGNAPDPARNRLVSLSLRPAQVTDQWLSEGPQLDSLTTAAKGLTLIEANQPKSEALAIAIALREAVENGRTSALITPDRTLARRVAATLQRWDITPDDSAGVPLSLTPPGRLLRQVARMIGSGCAPGDLISVLKHPLVSTGSDDRGPHLLNTRRLELYCRRRSIFVITGTVLADFADKLSDDSVGWVAWLKDVLKEFEASPESRLNACLTHHITLCELLAHGDSSGSGELWLTAAGRSCEALIQSFIDEADYKGAISFSDYVRFLEAALSAENDREPDGVHPSVMIWGTLEARVQGADLVVLGGLNEGTWPEPTKADPWLNRRMRKDLGLLLPEGQVGLAAHDYQQAIAADHAILTRSKRGEDGEAVPSRWLNRLTNLLEGLPEQDGPAALEEMKHRGDRFLTLVDSLDRPSATVAPEPRPAPAPPNGKRPKNLSVTEIKTLIRDPYAIYAKHVLHLRPLLPLQPTPDARLKGIVFHDIMEGFFAPLNDFSNDGHAKETLFKIAETELTKTVPWPAIRSHWKGQLEQIADHLIGCEQSRRETGQLIGSEVRGVLKITEAGVSITGIADRIDRLNTGDLIVYDYKTGAVPSRPQVRYFDRQLLIEAVIAEEGGFEKLPPATVERVEHLHLGRTPKDSVVTLVEDYETVTVSEELADLLTKYSRDETGYISRRAMEKMRYDGDYDHLARFGEWDASFATKPWPVK
ncbi:double-strand break repair protein AddB [Rhodobacteraceae bacterium]|nr:double-strand break repair protein AddB [Paracoccaceae bacterium]